MSFKKRPGFSFLDMMMYVSLVALSLHYAIPSYRLLVSKIQSQSLIQEVQQSQLQIYEHFLLTGSLPEEDAFDENTSGDDHEIQWDGQTLTVTLYESQSSQPSHLQISPSADEYRMSWTCEYDGSASMKTYLCYALT